MKSKNVSKVQKYALFSDLHGYQEFYHKFNLPEEDHEIITDDLINEIENMFTGVVL